MAHLKTKGLAVVLIVGPYPILEASVVTDVSGTGWEESMSYAGVGMPKFAKSEMTEGYETYIEPTLACWSLTEWTKNNSGKTTVAGMILACMSESSHHTGAMPVLNLDVIVDESTAK